MKKFKSSSVIFLLTFIAFLACDKKEKVFLANVDTASVDEIYNTSARVGGRVTDNGGAEITERGVYWGTSEKPEKTGTKLQSGSGNGIFYEVLSELTSGMKYYVTAYAVNSLGASYGNETFFTTQISLPTVTTSAITEYTSTSARVGGVISDNGGFEITRRGIYWGTEPDPRNTGAKIEIGSGDGDFSVMLTGLSRDLTYYVIAFAANIKGSSYGVEINFVTGPEKPVVFTSAISDITAYSAKAGGVVSSGGGMDVTERGIFLGTSANQVANRTKLAMGSGTGSFAATLDNLNPAVTYYITAYAVNSIGTSYGEEKSFLTAGKEPTVTASAITSLTSTGVKLNALVNAHDVTTNVIFEYGTTSSYGSIADAAGNPLPAKDTIREVSANLTGLVPLTIYHYRIKASNVLGTVNSADSTFRTVITGIKGSVTDAQGNTYETIGIGYQEWMTVNLRSTVFKNGGGTIPMVKKDSLWEKLITPAYCWYDKDTLGKYIQYGILYNWYTVETGNLCPAGWRVPSKDDFSQLVAYLGGSVGAGAKLKETGTDYWKSPNSGATDEYGFHARAGGKRSETGIFDFLKVEGNWWSSTEYSTLNGSSFNILSDYNNSFQSYYSKKSGMSVRCVKD